MELLTLDANNQADKLVENYESLIWAERFNTTSDFVLTSGKIEQCLQSLPEGKIVTLRESRVPMIVETHQIDRKKNAAPLLTVRGRSFDSILDRRVAVQSLNSTTGSENWTVNTKTPSDLAHYVMVQICVAGVLDAADIFPGSQVQFLVPSDYLASSGPVKAFDVSRGNLLTTIQGLIQTQTPADLTTSPVTPEVLPHGLRSIRPSASGTAIAIEIYPAVDRSATVYFDASRDQLDDGTYLFSKVGSGNAAYGVGEGLFAKMYEGAANPTGLDRRVILVDASTSGIADVEILRNEMSISLSEAKETAMFDGSVNEDLIEYVYGIDYDLGDIVKVAGDYGLNELARVTEYIRTEDSSGYRAFPTLSALPY